MKRTLRSHILAAGILFLALSVTSLAADWDGSDGPFAVKRIDRVTLRDAGRNKVVEASLLYPDGRGPFPLIVFSHGYGGSKDNYQLVNGFWASHGYVVLQPSHEDAGAIQTLRDLVEIKDIWKVQRPPEWRNRVADLVLMIDSIETLERRHAELRGKIDRSRIGVAGHSYGGLTTELIAGTKSFAEEPPIDLHEPRIRAAIAMSPEGTSEDLGFTEESFQNIGIPTMFMTGSLDRGAGGHPADWRREAFEYARPGGKYLVFIEGARHMSFSGRLLEKNDRPKRRRAARRGDSGASFDRESEEAIFSWIQGASLAFWDTYLKDSKAARSFLASDELVERSGGKLELKRK